MTDFAAKDASLEDKDKELASNIVNIFDLTVDSIESLVAFY